jgi:hypothetical protein
MKLIKKGIVRIFRDIEKIKGNIIHFEGGSQETFDAIIMATGYKTGIEKIVQISPERADDIQLDIKRRKYFGQDNLYFCGFYVSPTGMLREINIESGYIADTINESK